MSRLESLSAYRRSPVSERETRNQTLIYQGFGPLGAHMFSHFARIGMIVGEYDGEEVPRHAEKVLGAKVFTYERKKGVRHSTALFQKFFYDDYREELAAAIAGLSGSKIFVPFNATPALEKFLFESAPDVFLAQNPVIVREFFEDKIRLALHAQEIQVPLPRAAQVQFLGQVAYEPLAEKYQSGFVMQIPFSQHGGGTDFIFKPEDFDAALGRYREGFGTQFDRTQVKITPYLAGPSLNCTGCVVHGAVALSPPDIQIVGDPNFIGIAGAYMGSDFSFRLPDAAREEILAITERIGRWLGTHGYRGNFGVDLLSNVDAEGRISEIFVSEINARLVGESQYMADFEAMQDIVPLTFFHLAEFLRWEVTPQEVEAYNRALHPVQGAALLLYTRKKGIFKATGGLTSGVYRMEGERPVRLRDGWTLSDTRAADEFVITNGVPWEGLVIGHPRYGNENIALCYLMTRESVLDPARPKRVSEKWVRVARAVEAAIGLVETEPKSLREDH